MSGPAGTGRKVMPTRDSIPVERSRVMASVRATEPGSAVLDVDQLVLADPDVRDRQPAGLHEVAAPGTSAGRAPRPDPPR